MNKPGIEAYRNRCKRLYLEQNLLLIATEIFQEEDAQRLLNNFFEALESTTSCKAVELSINHNKIFRAPVSWQGWETLDADDSVIIRSFSIDALPNQKFRFALAPLHIAESKERDRLLGALVQQFGIISAKREIASRQARFRTWLDSFLEDIFRGSRSAILARGKDIEEERYAYVSSDNLDNFVRASVMDVQLQLQLAPSLRASALSLAAIYDKTNAIKSDDLLVRLVQLRCDSYEILENKATQQRKILGELKECWEKVDEYELPSRVQKVYHHCADKKLEELTSKLKKYYGERMARIELLRTHLFAIYCSSSSVQEIANRNNIKFCEDIANSEVLLEKKALPFRELLSEELSSFLEQWQFANGRIRMNTEWLLCWFGIRFIADFPWKNIEIDYAPKERALLFKHFSVYCLYLIHCIRNFGNPKLFRFSDVKNGSTALLDATFFLLGEYAHQVCSLSRQVPLYKSLKDIWSSEAILYTIRASYRDHLHHVLNVCLLSLVFIEAGLIHKFHSINDKDELKQIRKNWILAGLLHDIGYPVDISKHLLKHLAFLDKIPNVKNFIRNINEKFEKEAEELKAELNSRIDFEKGLVEKFANDVIKKIDHGVVSSIYLLFLGQANFINNEEAVTRWKNEIEPAFHAILTHNLKNEIFINPTDSDHPLSFLLLLCDHLQEWERPRVDSIKLRHFVTSELSDPHAMSIDRQTIVDYMEVNLHWDAKGKSIKFNSFGKKLTIELHFKDAGKEKFEPAITWCQNYFDFQSVEYKKWPDSFKIEFKTVHPLSERLKINNETYFEMDMFQDFLRENECDASLAEWLLKSRYGGSSCTYQQNKEKEEEIEKFVITFSSDTERLIECIPSKLFENFSKWKEQYITNARWHCFGKVSE